MKETEILSLYTEMCDELSFCTLCSLFPINTKSMSFYREVLVSTPSLFLFYPPNLPPRQVVRRSLLFFLLSLPSCEKSFYCRVSPNCVGRDECGDPDWNDLFHLFERDVTTSCPELRLSPLGSLPGGRFDNFLLFFTMDRATRTYTSVTYALVQARWRNTQVPVANAGRSTRDLNLSHPASYTALTRTSLVPAKESEGTISLFWPPNGTWWGSDAACWRAASWSGKGFLSTGNQQLLLVFFLDKNFCDLPKAQGDHTLRSS